MSKKENLFKKKYRIKSTRLQNWDYSNNGYYFVTICSKDRVCLFGDIIDGKMILSDLGNFVFNCWKKIPKHFTFVILDENIIMPNHIHGIIIIRKNVETQNFASLHKKNKFGPQSMNLASIIRGFKIGVKKYVNQNGIEFKWQPRYHDRIIRNEKELYNIRKYIKHNPLKWEFDRNNPRNF